jgi:hypothetical protein
MRPPPGLFDVGGRWRGSAAHKEHVGHDHAHREGCGHVAVPHGDHVDYVHD